ncbi:MAG: hypothetical protein JJU20_01620 [Opitutales bacterium]|nr:hypothetical protein [Opitutales bacterium]
MAIARNIIEASFPTPLFEIQAADPGLCVGRVLLKAEFRAPLGNLEDRWAKELEASRVGNPESQSTNVTFAPVAEERSLAVALAASVFNHKYVPMLTRSPSPCYQKILGRFRKKFHDGNAVQKVDAPKVEETASIWANYLLTALSSDELSGKEGRHWKSLVDEVFDEISPERAHFIFPVFPFLDDPEVMLKLRNDFPDSYFSFVWWPRSRMERPPKLEAPERYAIQQISLKEALLASVWLAENHGIIAAVPTGAVVHIALLFAHQPVFSDATLVPIGCHFYDREENYNPYAKRLLT